MDNLHIGFIRKHTQINNSTSDLKQKAVLNYQQFIAKTELQ